MNALFLAAEEVQRYCQERCLAFCFIGGLATLRWGEPRTTRDIDLIILAGFGSEGPNCRRAASTLWPAASGGPALRARDRVVLVTTTNGVPVDAALGALDFEERTVRRASPWAAGEVSLVTCSAEDLVVHKVFAGRDRDWADVAGIVTRQGPTLDRALISSELQPLLEAKGSTDHLRRLESLLGPSS